MKKQLLLLWIIVVINMPIIGTAQEIAVLEDYHQRIPEEYEIEEGDTLWSLSEEFFKDPWLWPNLWAINPHITNPHWIYPGDLIRLKWVKDQNQIIEALSLEPVVYDVQLKKNANISLNQGMIVSEKFEPLGVLAASPEPSDQLGTNDRIYLKIKNPKALSLGQTLSIYRPIESLIHPKTKDELGVKIILMGLAEVEGLEKEFVYARIKQSYQEIQRGDLIMEEQPLRLEISPSQNLVDAEGFLIDSVEAADGLGQMHTVFVDLGSKQGAQVGNRAFVLRQGDGLEDGNDEYDFEKMPFEQVGELMLVKVNENYATAIITRSALELKRGDKVVLQRNY
jgi:hypothetical protein